LDLSSSLTSGVDTLIGMFSDIQRFSQGESFVATQNGSIQVASGKPVKQETCLPVTVRSVEVAIEQCAEEGGELKFFGSEPSMLMLVAVVESCAKQGTNFEFTMNDATGRMKARYYVTTERASKELDNIRPGSYISMYGNVRRSSTVHFAVTGLRVVRSADEISYHMIECAHAAMRLQKSRPVVEPSTPVPRKHATSAGDGMEISPAKETEQVARPATLEPVSLNTAAPSAKVQEPQDLAMGLRDAIIAVVQKKGEDRPEGVSIEEVRTAVVALGGNGDEVRRVLDQLVDDAEVYTTLDDDHFKSTSS